MGAGPWISSAIVRRKQRQAVANAPRLRLLRRGAATAYSSLSFEAAQSGIAVCRWSGVQVRQPQTLEEEKRMDPELTAITQEALTPAAMSDE